MGFFGSSGSVGKITESDLPITVKEKLVKVNEIGDLSELQTKNKSSLTAATNEVTAQLADTEKQLDALGVNALAFGVKGDGTTDDTNKIKELLASHKNVYFPKPPVCYVVSDTIQVAGKTNKKEGYKITFANGAFIKPKENKPILRIVGIGNEINNLIIDVTHLSNTYTSSAVVFYSDTSNLPCVDNELSCYLMQNVKKGRAITFTALNDGYCYYNKIKNSKILFFECGIYFDNQSTMGVNNNTIDIDINSSQRIMYIKGAGNLFRGTHQATINDTGDSEFASIYVKDSNNNIFDMFVHDAGGHGLVQYAYELDNSVYNVINANTANQVKITNKSDNTNVILNSSLDVTYNNVSLPFKGDWSLGSSENADRIKVEDYYKRSYAISPLNNTLAHLKDFSSIVLETNDCVPHPNGSNINDYKKLLNHNSTDFLRYVASDPLLGGTVSFVVTLKSSRNIKTLGSIIHGTESARVRVKCYIRNDSSSEWTELKEINPILPRQVKSAYTFVSETANTTTQLKFSFVIPPNPNGSVANHIATIHYLFANYLGTTVAGSAVPYIGGDTYTGDIEFIDRNKSVVLKSQNGSRFRLSVNDDGTLSTTKL